MPGCVDAERALICLERQNNSTSRNLFKYSIFRLTADRMEAEVTLVEEQDETDKIREDIHRIEVQIERLKSEAPTLG